MFQHVVGRHGARQAFRYRVGEDFAGITYAELAARVEALATALLDLGVAPGQKLGLISDNRPEWILCDLACVSIGVPDVPRGSDSTVREIEYILGHADASGAFV
jgi:long-chain acyl-CoA synthetase